MLGGWSLSLFSPGLDYSRWSSRFPHWDSWSHLPQDGCGTHAAQGPVLGLWDRGEWAIQHTFVVAVLYKNLSANTIACKVLNGFWSKGAEWVRVNNPLLTSTKLTESLIISVVCIVNYRKCKDLSTLYSLSPPWTRLYPKVFWSQMWGCVSDS